jgi:hypothetical protein
LEFLVDHHDNDPSKWSVLQIFYNGQMFANTTALNTAFADTTSGLNRQQVPIPLLSHQDSQGPFFSCLMRLDALVE